MDEDEARGIASGVLAIIGAIIGLPIGATALTWLAGKLFTLHDYCSLGQSCAVFPMGDDSGLPYREVPANEVEWVIALCAIIGAGLGALIGGAANSIKGS